MKLKGINPFEQHVEKLVVGAVGVGLLGVVGWQFLSQSTVTVGKDQVGIADAYKPVESAASELLRKSETASPTLPEPVDISPLTKFPELFGKPVATAGTLPSMGSVLALGPGGGGGAAGDATYAAFVAPAASNLFAAQFRGTIDPRERVEIPALVPFLPKEQPLDKAAVSVEATMNGKALKAALEADPDAAGPLAALPADWWFDKVEIVGVEVERQELKADGSWSAATTLPAIPGRIDFLKRWNSEAKDGGAVATLVAEASTRSEEIQRPPFYDMIVGSWIEPSVLAAQAAANFDPNKFATLSQQFKQKSEQLAALKAELATLPPDERRRPEATPPPARSGGGGGGGGGGGRGATPEPGRGATPQPEAPKEETPAAKRARLTRQITQLESDIERIKKDVADMGGVLPDPLAPEGAPAEGPATPDAGTTKKLLDRDDFKLYAHDITAEPGKTYRYRLRVAMNNPIFGKEILLKKNDQAQLDLASASLAHSAWTDWTPEVTVDRDAYWFITSTNRDSLRQNIPTAQAEMYQYYYGYYRKAVASLEPGDPIIGEAKLPKLWLAPEGPVPAADPNVPAPVQPGGRDGGRGVVQQPAGNNQPGQPANPDVPPGPGWLPAKDKLVFRETASVVMLDVQPIPGLERQLLAILRSHDGEVVAKSPESDGKSDVYRRVRSSADAGELAAQPKIEPKQNRRPDREPEIQPEGPGGKGGGGGGGGGG
jgi:hypothetical protein